MPLLPLISADKTRETGSEINEAELLVLLVAMGMSPLVGVLELMVSREGEEPLKGPSLRRRACVAGDRGAVRWDLRLDLCIISTAQASRSTGVRLAACMKLS